MTRQPSLSGFGGMIAKKGEARPPEDQPQRAAAEVAEVEHKAPAKPTPMAVPEITKSLTLKLPMSEYKRLKRHAVEHGTHQDIISRALREYLDKFE